MQQVIIGLDTTEMVNEMESLGQSDDDSDFEDEDSDFEDDESDNYGKVITETSLILFVFFHVLDHAYMFAGLGFSSR